MSDPDRYAVIGHPISHSKSPVIHQQFAAQTGQNLSYVAIDIPPDALTTELPAFFAGGGKGMNVTLPYKEQIPALVNTASERATLAGAINTIVCREDGSLFGDNTDGEGLVNDMVRNLGADLEDSRILILGAGGATRGIIPDLLATKPTLITIANRTVSRARELEKHFDHLGNIAAKGYDDLGKQAYDVVIHATSAGLQGELPPLPDTIIGAFSFCYDLSYSNSDTPFVAWAKGVGCPDAHDGLGMLVEQAAAAFELWRGVRPDTQAVIEQLRRA